MEHTTTDNHHVMDTSQSEHSTLKTPETSSSPEAPELDAKNFVTNYMTDNLKLHYEQEIATLKTKNKNLKQQYDNDIGILKIEFEKLSGELVANRCKLVPLEIENGKLQKLYSGIEQSLQQKTQEWKDVTNELYNNKKKNCVLNFQCDDKEKQIKKLKDDNNCLSTLLENNKQKVKQCDSLNLKVEQQLQELSEKNIQIQQLTVSNIEVKEEVEQMQTEVEERKLKMLEMNSLKESLENKVTKLELEIVMMSEAAIQKIEQITALEQETKQKMDEMKIREDELSVREQGLFVTENDYKQKLKLCSQVLGSMNSVEEQIKALQVENKELHSEVNQKKGGLPKLSEGDLVLLRQGRSKQFFSKYNQDLDAQRKQLVAAQIMITKLEGQILESGQRPLKRSFLDPTIASASKKVCSSGKENSAAMNPNTRVI